MGLLEERNQQARERVLNESSRVQLCVWDGAFNGYFIAIPRLFGLLTHFHLEGDFADITFVSFHDLNFIQRFNAPLEMFPCHYGKVLLPVASVFFNPWHEDDWMIPDLRGAMYLNVTSANLGLQFTGKSNGFKVVQHCFDQLPVHDGSKPGYNQARGVPILPFLDLAARNQIVYSPAR